MPVYESYCEVCGKTHDYYQTVENRNDTPDCCGVKTIKGIFTPSMGIVDIPAYQSPVSGRWINSRKQRAEDLARTGSRPWEGMEQERKEAERRKAYQEAKEDAVLEKSIEKAIKDLPDEKKKVLQIT